MSLETRKQNKINDLRREVEKRGVCVGEDTELFYPGEDGTIWERRRRRRLAMIMCNICPVIALCDELADLNKEDFGIWGGKLRSSSAASRIEEARRNDRESIKAARRAYKEVNRRP